MDESELEGSGRSPEERRDESKVWTSDQAHFKEVTDTSETGGSLSDPMLWSGKGPAKGYEWL